MPEDRFSRIRELFAAAQALPNEKRAEFLERATPDDLSIREEVRSLLDASPGAESFLEGSPLSSSLPPGTRIGHFEVLGLLGRGGMGEVYRARDSRLKRDVAIKVLPPAFVRDPNRVARFEREARVAGALNHPNIVAVYDTGQDRETYWIATELVVGEPLTKVIEHGPLAPRKAIEIARQIADGLTAAHAAGIIHRDLKPGNVMIVRDGRVKILDFGLAKQQRAMAAETVTQDLSGEGTVMGTAGYMSPEQVRGEALDQRSDLFSFGVIVYEMLAGKRAFSGRSSVEVMHAILKDDPPELPATVPPGLERIVRRCLEKESDRRFQSAADLGFALQSLGSFQSSPTVSERTWLRRTTVAIAFVTIAGAMLFWLSRPLPKPRVTGMVQITRDGRASDSVICPLLSDGVRLFFGTGDNVPVYQVSINGGAPTPFALQTRDVGYVMDITRDRTELLLCRIVKWPFCELWAEPLVSGPPRRVGSIVAELAAAWSPDGEQLVYGNGRELHLATRDGTAVRKLATFGSSPHFLCWSPDGRRIRVSVDGEYPNPTRVWEVLPDGTGLRQVLPGWNPSWSMYDGLWTPDGKNFVFLSNRKIWAVREQESLFKRGGREPVELDTGLLSADHLLFGADGKRLYFEGFNPRHEFLRYDGKSGGFSLDLAGISGSWLEFSKDGKRIVYVSVPEGTLFTASADGTQRLQLTWPPLQAAAPRWSPDAKQIAFVAHAPGKSDRIYIMPSDGGTPQQVSNGEASKNGDWDPSWSPDGASLAFGPTLYDKPDEAFIHVVDVRTKRISTLPGSQGMWSPRWSPKGDFIAGNSKFEGLGGLMLYDLQKHTQAELFNQGANYPNWSPDGEFLYFYRDPNLWRFRIRNRKMELVSRLKFAPANFGWFVVARDDSLITARNIGGGDIYALELELP
jgi:serine/threonine protein kinase/Tol biopolymer transport system component